AALLIVAAVAADLVDAEVRMRAIGQPDRGGGARDFLHRDAVLEIAEPRPAPFLLDRDAVHAQLAELGAEVGREGVAAVDLVGARGDALGGETAHAVAQHVGGLAQTEIKAARVVHAHGRRSRVRGPAGPPSKVDVRLMHVLDRARNIAGRRPRLRAFYSAAATRPAPCAKGPARQQCRVADPRGAAEKRMKLGYFTMPVHAPARRYVETLKEDREAFILADRLGYSEGYCGEHLTDAAENIPNSMMFIATLLGATSQMKVGTAVVNLPHSHPVVVASNAAML